MRSLSHRPIEEILWKTEVLDIILKEGGFLAGNSICPGDALD